jgi:mono/diheme cytochrome c family protein
MPVAGLVRSAALHAATIVAMLATSWSPSVADEAKEAEGARLYRQNCASCHGMTGQGDGPVAERLKAAPRPLTTLARRHAGTFPTEYVYRIIDGREERRAHGGRNMPVWGTYYGLRAQGQGRDAPDTETAIRERIIALIAHLKSIQVGYTAGAGETAATATLLERHLKAFGARDVDAVMAAYADDSVLVIPTGVLQGREQIGDYYEALFAEFGKPGTAFNLLERTVVGNVAHIVWSGETPDNVYEYTAETFAVEDGKIHYQITAFKTAAR